MRLFAYEGGLGAVVVRRAVFALVINGGKAGIFAGSIGDGFFVVGNIDGGDGLFVVEESGVGEEDDSSVAMMLDKAWIALRNKKGLRF